MNNPFDYTPDAECEAAFRELLAGIDTLRSSGREDDAEFCRELSAGKMLGVLIAEDAAGVRRRLFAFSGQLGSGGFHRKGFVGPVFDYLAPNGYFKTKEAEITHLNFEIARFEKGAYAARKDRHESMKAELDAEVAEFKEQ
ncbi:MAG: RNA pseudouridine synthase, partial [Muribaculaceae bacterium]|nr:RNA pseudouridine synthase [Muribaculaceae bacterium]